MNFFKLRHIKAMINTLFGLFIYSFAQIAVAQLQVEPVRADLVDSTIRQPSDDIKLNPSMSSPPITTAPPAPVIPFVQKPKHIVIATPHPQCAKPDSIIIDPPITIDHLNPNEAVAKIANIGNYILVSEISSSLTITAKNISGTMTEALTRITDKASIGYRVDTDICQIVLYSLQDASLAIAYPMHFTDNLSSVPENLVYSLRTGNLINEELVSWATPERWQLIWQVPSTWRVFANAAYRKKSAVEAISEVITQIRAEGKAIRMVVYEGNRVIEILPTDLIN
jgi:hypothetical protein